MKRFISFLTAFSITLVLLSGSPNIAEAATTGGCSGHSGMTIWHGGVVSSGNYYLNEDVDLNSVRTITGNLTLCLNGYTITAKDNVRIFYINEGGTLTLCDCKGTGKLIGNDVSSQSNALNVGGVICIAGEFIMNGGTISGCKAVVGSGVNVNSTGTFIMNGGTISDNTATRSGGGVNVNGNFKMTGGTISGNTAGVDGSGVNIGQNATFTMTGGTITSNVAEGEQGGAIWFYSDGSVTLDGNVNITGNTKNGSASNVYADGNTIKIGSNFSPSSKVGVTTSTTPANCTKYVDVTGTYNTDIKNSFTADKDGQRIVYNDNKVQLTGAHGTATHTTAKAATCTANGNVEYWTCPNCKNNYDSSTYKNELTSTVTNATGHSTTETKAKAATCIADGNKAYWYCSNCKKYYSNSNCTTETTLAATAISKTGHNYGNWSVTNDPTLTATGTAKRTCANDTSHIETKDVPKLSTANGWTKSNTIKDPKPNENGEYVYTSIEYGSITVTVPKLTDSSWTKNETQKPTVNGNGEYTYTSGYGDVTVTVPSLSDPIWSKTNTAEPTVTDNGLYTYTSTDYGNVTVDIPKLSDNTVWTNTEHVEPDEYTDGRDVYTSVYGEIEVILPALGHTHNLTQVAAKEATCTAAGNGAYWTCSCGKYFSDENGETEISEIPTIPALGHNYADGKCTRCGNADPDHEHTFVDGECACGAPDPTYVPPHEHIFADDGKCINCGAPDPSYRPSGSVTEDINVEFAQEENTLIDIVLTAEDKAEIENGSSFKIVLEITDSVSDTDKNIAPSALSSGEEIGVYVDLSLFKIKDGTNRTRITDTNAHQIGITLTIPDNIYAPDRTYSIIRVHNGIAENLGGTYDRTNRTLTFYTDKFSTYAIAYTASSVSIDSPTIPSRPSVPTVPTNPTPVTPSVSPSVSPSEPNATPTVTETASQVEEEVISDDEPYVEDVSSGAADDSDDGGITDVSMEVIVLAIAAVIVAVILVKKIVF